MRLMYLGFLFLVASILVACNPSSSEDRSAAINRSSPAQSVNPDLLSTGGELFPLSAYYGVCTKRTYVLRASIDEGMLGYPMITEITGGAGKLRIGVGKFGLLPGTTTKEIPATSLPRRIQIFNENGNDLILVSGFEGAGQNVVSIDYDEADPEAQADAVRFANDVVACHISALPAKQGQGS
jgi:hypothetical protein